MRKIFTIKNFLRCLLSVTALVFLVFGWTAIDIYWQSQVTSNANADAAIVLGASIYKDVPSPVFQERINHAVNLYKNGAVKYIIFTGGFGQGEKFSEAVVAKNYALSKDVPADHIYIEEQSRTTFQNLYFAKEIMQKHKLNTVLIVSDPLHIKRAVVMAQDLNIENSLPSPTPTSKFISLNKKLVFLFEETRLLLMYQTRKLFLKDFVGRELSVKSI